MNAISTFSEFPQTPKERESFVELCVNEILSGKRNPLEFELMLKNLEDTVNAIRKNDNVKEAIYKEAEKYPTKSFLFGNYEITRAERTTFDFSNDSVYCDLKEKLKARENLLKAIRPSFEQIADGTTGEMLTPPLTKSSRYLTIKYKG